MATSQQRALPTLRISAEQLEERAKQVRKRRQTSRGAPLRQHGDNERVEQLGTHGKDFVGNASRFHMTESKLNKGHGERRQYSSPRVNSQTDSLEEATNGSVDGSGRNREGTKENLLTAWKKCCAGKTEKLLVGWSENKSAIKLSVILNAIAKFESLSEKLVLKDLELSMKLDVCSQLWKHGHYPVIEALRKMQEDVRADLGEFLHSSEQFYWRLLDELQSCHSFSLGDYTTGRLEFPSRTRQRVVMQAVSICHQCYISLGDLSRYCQQLIATPNWGKPRIHYLKARELAPKDGKPYNKLGVVALKANHRLDAIYYYMRSLMAKNPFKSAYDSLIGLFEDTSTKVKRQEEEELRSRVKSERASARKQRRQHHKRRQKGCGRELIEREVWIMPGHREDDGVAEGVVNKSPPMEQDNGDLSLSSGEILKKLVSSFLIAHGKLFTRIGIETIDSSVSNLKHYLTLHLTHTLTPTDAHTLHTFTTGNAQRLVQMTAINVFSIHHCVDAHVDNATSQQFYCGLAVSVALQTATTLLQHCVASLQQACSNMPFTTIQATSLEQLHALGVNESTVKSTGTVEPSAPSTGPDVDLQKTSDISVGYSQISSNVRESDIPAESLTVQMKSDGSNFTGEHLLACVDVLSITLPSVRVWLQWMARQRTLWGGWVGQVDKQVMYKFWTVLCSLLNLSQTGLPSPPSLLEAVSGSRQWQFWEDRMLSGFLPLGSSLSTQDTLSIPEFKTLSIERHREQAVQRVADIARLCVELSSTTNYGLTFDSTAVKFDIPEAVSDLIRQTPSPPGDTSYQDSESSDDVIIESSSENETGGDKDEVNVITETPSEIEQLKADRERLTKTIEEQSQALQNAKSILAEAAHTELNVRKITPRYLVPDTNCFVDLLDSIKHLVATAQFTIAVPLVVLSELEGLSKGSNEDNSVHVTAGSRAAIEFVRRSISERYVHVRALTTQGSLLSTISFSEELTHKASNDDLILTSCQQLHSKVDHGDRHSVVLLTDDRNLRVKALAGNLPVKDMPSFMKLL